MAQNTAMNVKEAVNVAREHLKWLFPIHGDIELEEVESISQDSGWRITFSYERDEPDPVGIRRLLPPQPGDRIYKIVTIDSSGNPISVKIRENGAH
jgi:hypothetical protein